uniref:Uncharacterized protein n=1 Tax=Chaetoceros debilis TaxID=122233 RepID=A0A6S8SLM6_9STRA
MGSRQNVDSSSIMNEVDALLKRLAEACDGDSKQQNSEIDTIPILVNSILNETASDGGKKKYNMTHDLKQTLLEALLHFIKIICDKRTKVESAGCRRKRIRWANDLFLELLSPNSDICIMPTDALLGNELMHYESLRRGLVSVFGTMIVEDKKASEVTKESSLNSVDQLNFGSELCRESASNKNPFVGQMQQFFNENDENSDEQMKSIRRLIDFKN